MFAPCPHSLNCTVEISSLYSRFFPSCFERSSMGNLVHEVPATTEDEMYASLPPLAERVFPFEFMIQVTTRQPYRCTSLRKILYCKKLPCLGTHHQFIELILCQKTGNAHILHIASDGKKGHVSSFSYQVKQTCQFFLFYEIHKREILSGLLRVWTKIHKAVENL